MTSDNGYGSFCLPHFMHHVIFNNHTQDFCNAPSLRETSARTVGRIAIENLGDMTKTSFGQMTRESIKPHPNLILNLLSVAVYLEIRVDKRAEQPCPDRSLMIRAVSRD